MEKTVLEVRDLVKTFIVESSWPSMSTSPDVGVSSAARIDNSVVFPLPLGPTSPTNSPA